MSPEGQPHIVPITFAVDGDVIYTAVDFKPKSTPRLRRLSNIHANPRVAVLAEHVDDLVRLLSIRADIEDEVAGLADLVVDPLFRVAVSAQDVQLAGEIGGREQVASLGVARHETQSLPLSAAADHDRRVWLGERLRGVQRAIELIVRAAERSLVAAPHLQADLQRLLKPLE